MPRSRVHRTDLNGLLVVDKPLHWSSMDVVRRVRRAAGGAKTGHAGTLDPLATGVVVCCLGKATRSVEQLMKLSKRYEATVDLAAFTSTDDREGERQEIAVTSPPALQQVQAALQQFIGTIDQTPPAYSAVHVAGQRAYKLARRGETVQIEPRPVHIASIDVSHYDWPLLTIVVTCGKGTYIRSLARDLGHALHTGGHLAALRRTAVGPYDLAVAVSADRLDDPIEAGDLLPIPDSPGSNAPSPGAPPA